MSKKPEGRNNPGPEALTDDEVAGAAGGAYHSVKLENATISSIKYRSASADGSITDGTSNTFFVGERDA